MRLTSIGVHHPQVNVPGTQPTLHVGNVLPIGGPNGHTNRDLWIVLEGDLAALLGLDVQYPEISVSTAVAEIYEFTISGRNRRRFNRACLVRDLDSAKNILLRTARDRITPNIKVDMPSSSYYIAAAIHVRRNV